MPLLVRAIAFFTSLAVYAAIAEFALLIHSMEPSRAMPLPLLTTFLACGLIGTLGHMLVAFYLHRLAFAAWYWRWLVGLLLLIPFGVAVLFLRTANSIALAILYLVVVAGTIYVFSASVWPSWIGRSNPSLQRTALPPAELDR